MQSILIASCLQWKQLYWTSKHNSPNILPFGVVFNELFFIYLIGLSLSRKSHIYHIYGGRTDDFGLAGTANPNITANIIDDILQLYHTFAA